MRPARRRLTLFSAAIAVLAAVLASLLPAGIASAASHPAAGNRVWAISLDAPARAWAGGLVSADQHLGEAAWCPFYALGSCVAPEDAAAAAGDTAAARGGVYALRDEAGNVVRTGRSSNLAAREAAHFNDPVLGQFEFQVEYRTNVYAEQRGLEQLLYDQYPGAQAVNGGYNMIRGISPLNPNGPGYMQAAYDYLGRLTGGG